MDTQTLSIKLSELLEILTSSKALLDASYQAVVPELAQTKGERDAAIAGRTNAEAELVTVTGERNAKVAELAQATSEGDAKVAQLAQTVLEKETALATINALTDEKNALQGDYDALLVENEALKAAQAEPKEEPVGE